MNENTDIFGKVSLGYVVVETDKFADWRRFGVDAVGMHVDETLPDVMRFRLDDNECRFLLQRGPAEDVTALGWQIDDHSAFEIIEARIRSHGVPVTPGSAEEAALRGVERFIRVPGPNGMKQEIFTRARSGEQPLSLGVDGGFVTGAAGMGHVAVAAKNPRQMRGYYDTVFNARLSDFIEETFNGMRVKIRFLRVNERHHTIAIGSVNRLPVLPVRTRVQHCNVQVAQLDDMVGSFGRMKQLGFTIAMTVGQHTNDRELSYYAVTPSGFELEVGWNPIVVDESTWEPTTHQGISLWGHTQEGRRVIDIFRQMQVASRSLLQREDNIPALAGAGIADD